MFDETKNVRIKIYNAETIKIFFIIIISGFIGFIILGLERLAAVGFLVFIINIVFDFIAPATNMLILNFPANVQIIRKIQENPLHGTVPAALSTAILSAQALWQTQTLNCTKVYYER